MSNFPQLTFLHICDALLKVPRLFLMPRFLICELSTLSLAKILTKEEQTRAAHMSGSGLRHVGQVTSVPHLVLTKVP